MAVLFCVYSSDRSQRVIVQSSKRGQCQPWGGCGVDLALCAMQWCEPGEWARLTGSGWQKPEPEADGESWTRGGHISPTQLLSPAGGGTGHSLICSVTSDTRLPPSLPGITTHGQGLANWVSQDPGHKGVRVKLDRTWDIVSDHQELTSSLTGGLGGKYRGWWLVLGVSVCVSVAPTLWLWPCISAEDSQRKHLQGSTA